MRFVFKWLKRHSLLPLYALQQCVPAVFNLFFEVAL